MKIRHHVPKLHGLIAPEMSGKAIRSREGEVLSLSEGFELFERVRNGSQSLLSALWAILGGGGEGRHLRNALSAS